MESLVSIITPCYNGEKTISRLIDSVLAQSYKNIEFILINDGSNDQTEAIVKSYENNFVKKGYKFKYIYQKNAGLGGAINTGLKIFEGEYLCWVDADDYLEPTSVEDRINVFKAYPEYAVVTSNAYVRNGNNLDDYKLMIIDEKSQSDEWQFDNLLNEKSIFCSGTNMVRTTAFLDVNPNREIYAARRGQNWQILLPLFYKYKRYYLHKPLYNYIDYPNSMSKNKATLNNLIERYDEHKLILMKTLQMIEDIQKADINNYKTFIDNKYFILKLSATLKYKNYKLFDEFYANRPNKFSFKLALLLIRRKFKFLNELYLKIR